MSLKGMFKEDVITIRPDALVTEAAMLMRDHKIGDVVVIDGDGKSAPIGLITDRDIALHCVAGQLEQMAQLRVGDVMSRDIVCAKVSDGIYELIRKMRDEGIARIPVLADDGALCGIITAKKLLALISEELSSIIAIADSHKEAGQQAMRTSRLTQEAQTHMQ